MNFSFSQRTKETSALLQDDPEGPADERSVRWIEYVVRHKGAHHLRKTGGSKLNFFQYYLIDIAAIVGAICLAVLSLVYVILETTVRVLVCKKDRSHKNGSAKKRN